MNLKIISDSNSKQNVAGNIKNIIAVAAGKGGVGKSTVAVNLALALKNQGFQVGLLDADIYGPSVLHMLPEGIWPVQDPQNPERILPGLTLGLKFISTAHFKNKKEGSVVRAPIANSIISQFLKQVNWGELDYLVIDFPPGTGDIQLTLMQQSNLSGALIVTTPQEISLLDVRKSMHMFEDLQVPLLGVIENMSFFLVPTTQEKYFPFGSGGGKKCADEFGVHYFGEIAIDPILSHCGDRGESVFSHAPESATAAFFNRLAKKMKPLLAQHVDMIKNIRKEDDSFTIAWADGTYSSYNYRELQKHCPCASCQENRRSSASVSAVDIVRVGHYGLKIVFTSGCAKGIYSFRFLRKWPNI